MLTDSDEVVLKKRIIDISEGVSVTDKEYYELLKKLVLEYSESFPTEGKVKSLEYIVDFIFLFIEEMHRDRHFHNEMLVYFCRETIQELLLLKRWQKSEGIAFRLLTHLALTSTYTDGKDRIITEFDNWVSVSHLVIEEESKNGVEWNDLGRYYFFRLSNMYIHDLLFMPAIEFWNKLLDRFGDFKLDEVVKTKLSEYLDFIEESNAGKPSVIAERFERLHHFTHRLDCEEYNNRLTEGILRYKNL